MKILIDMVHLADVNFYKRALNDLKHRHDITIAVIDRGRLPYVVKKEYPDFEVEIIGKHYSGKFAKIFGLLQRTWRFLTLFLKIKPDVVSSFGFYPGLVAKWMHIPAVLFHDDYEYRFMFKMCQRFATDFYVPDSIRDKLTLASEDNSTPGNMFFYEGFKETAYLKNFQPDESCLDRHQLRDKPFVFCRDIANVSMNYDDYQAIDLAPLFQYLNDKGYAILYYPEQDHDRYDHLCLKMLGGIPDILSLQYYASLTISSGDTIARESALLGTPVIYVGGRQMAVNKPLEDLGFICSINKQEELLQCVDGRLAPSFKEEMRAKADDVHGADLAQVIVKALERYAPKTAKEKHTSKIN